VCEPEPDGDLRDGDLRAGDEADRRAAWVRRRERAAVQLARLADAGVHGAHPDDWYGVAPVSSTAPLRAPGELVPVSPSDVEKIVRCPLRWVLERHGGGEPGALAAVTGSLVHALVQARASGADGAELEGALATAWSQLDAGAPWFGRRELGRVRTMLAAFDDWVRASRAEGLRLVAVEQPVRLDLPGTDLDRAATGAGTDGLQLRGRVDRLEVDADGRPVVVDVKTGKVAVTSRDAAEHPQLAIYQLAAALGGFGRLLAPGAAPGGARLVYLADQKAGGEVKQPVQPPLDETELAHWEGELRRSARESSGATFLARAGPGCNRCPVRTSCPVSEDGRPLPEP
jgi:RecB family exonuclease